MRRLLLAVALVGCPAGRASSSWPASGIGPAVVWNAGNGWVTLTIDRSGDAVYDFHPSGWGAGNQKARSARMTLARVDLDALASTLATHDACSLSGSRRTRVPEEQDQSLKLDLPGAQCSVTMLTNDWSQGERAQAVSDALNALAQRVSRDGK
jgi:hypothetical protein